ncbi:MAG: sigma-54 dependent transcriptional regulator [Planctomycetota bacterium]
MDAPESGYNQITPGNPSQFDPAGLNAGRTQEVSKAAATASASEFILIADDDPTALHYLDQSIRDLGYKTQLAKDGQEAIDALHSNALVAIVDLRMPLASGLDCLHHVREHYPDTQVIMISGNGEINDAVAAMKEGACDYITKPVDSETLKAVVAQAVSNARLAREHRGLKAAISTSGQAANFATTSKSSQALMKQVHRVASLDSTVLLTGESGTGKSTVARMIHQQGNRSNGPFVSINCASLPRDLIEAELFGHSRGAFTGAISDRPGRAEIAHGGTLFLDEIGDLPLELQPKLLTFLQDRTVQRIGSNTQQVVDVRLITATHHDLQSMCDDGSFRQDLYYRLNVFNMEVPSLRNRRADIIVLTEHILDRISRQRNTTAIRMVAEAFDLLKEHPWPGNVRELENILERASAFCDNNTIRVDDIKPMLETPAAAQRQNGSYLAGRTLRDIERQAIIETLEYCGGNKARAAREMGISEKSIYNKMRRLEIMPPKNPS